jgi:hypothetical protein
MAKIVCVLYEDPVTGYPRTYARGKLAGAGAHSYSAGDATRGSEEAVRFKIAQGAGESTDR